MAKAVSDGGSTPPTSTMKFEKSKEQTWGEKIYSHDEIGHLDARLTLNVWHGTMLHMKTQMTHFGIGLAAISALAVEWKDFNRAELNAMLDKLANRLRSDLRVNRIMMWPCNERNERR